MPTLGFRFRAYADAQTLRALKAQLRLACEVYNTLRWADMYFYQRDGKGLNRTDLRQIALELRKQDQDYKGLHSQVVQQIADRYHDARQRFFDGLARFPRERKPHKYYSLAYPQSGWKVTDVREIRTRSKKNKKMMTLRLSHLGVFKVMVHRDFPLDKVNRLIVKLTKSEKIYIIFVVEGYEFPKLPNAGNMVAIDVGVEKMLVTSDAQYFPNLRPLEKALWKVKYLHKSLSRKRFLSHNWFKAKITLAKAYEHLQSLRRDLYMRLGKWFAEHYDVLVMEDIHVTQLVGKSSKSLRRRLTDVSFGELREVMKYQLEKYGKKLVLVNPAYTSKTCTRCGHVSHDLSLSDRVFTCPNCGWTTDRDYNASLNILHRSGSEPVEPVELSPLPVLRYWQGRAVKQEATSVRAG